jgi:hypothetical protein
MSPRLSDPASGFYSDKRRKKSSQPMPEIAETCGENPVSIFDVGTYQCRYPLNATTPIHDFRYCGGETKEPFGYCKNHTARCYNLR